MALRSICPQWSPWRRPPRRSAPPQAGIPHWRQLRPQLPGHWWLHAVAGLPDAAGTDRAARQPCRQRELRGAHRQRHWSTCRTRLPAGPADLRPELGVEAVADHVVPAHPRHRQRAAAVPDHRRLRGWTSASATGPGMPSPRMATRCSKPATSAIRPPSSTAPSCSRRTTAARTWPDHPQQQEGHLRHGPARVRAVRGERRLRERAGDRLHRPQQPDAGCVRGELPGRHPGAAGRAAARRRGREPARQRLPVPSGSHPALPTTSATWAWVSSAPCVRVAGSASTRCTANCWCRCCAACRWPTASMWNSATATPITAAAPAAAYLQAAGHLGAGALDEHSRRLPEGQPRPTSPSCTRARPPS